MRPNIGHFETNLQMLCEKRTVLRFSDPLAVSSTSQETGHRCAQQCFLPGIINQLVELAQMNNGEVDNCINGTADVATIPPRHQQLLTAGANISSTDN